MRRTPINRTVDPSHAHARVALEQFGVTNVRDVAREVTARDAASRGRANLPRITGNWTDGSALGSLLDALVKLGLVVDETGGSDALDTTDSDLQVTGRLKVPFIEAVGSAPSAAAGAAMGTTPGALTVTGGDLSATITQDSGTAPTTGTMWTVTFATAKANSSYRVVLTPFSFRTAALNLYVSSKTTTGFVISCATAPGASFTQRVDFIVIDD